MTKITILLPDASYIQFWSVERRKKRDLCEKLHLFMCNDGVAATRKSLMSHQPVTVLRRLKSVTEWLKLAAGQLRHRVKSFINANANILSRDCCKHTVAMNLSSMWKRPNASNIKFRQLSGVKSATCAKSSIYLCAMMPRQESCS